MRDIPIVIALLLIILGVTQTARADTANRDLWIILEADAARVEGDRLIWEFSLERPWK